MKSRRTVNNILGVLKGIGFFEATSTLNPNVLTVLNYHRIENVLEPGFDTFKPNVSATPEGFTRQMDYVRKRFNVITCDHLAAWVRGDSALPSHAAIITFDDGYRDNLANAYPVLKSRNLSAVIFLTTGFMGADAPFYWDHVAYCFFHTKEDHALLPLTGERSWSDESTREQVMMQWIEALKKLPEIEKRAAIQGIADILDVSIPDGAFAGLYLTWDQIREMSRNGIEFGSHTVHHPILTRVSLDQARQEMQESIRRIESEIGKPVRSFAYPNGQPTDFNAEIMDVVSSAGIQLAFTLLPGPTRYSSVKRNPMAIRRIFLDDSDTFPRFVAKLSGAARLIK